MTRLPAAVLWDFDGTLIDSEPLWQRVHAGVVGDLGGEWTGEISAGMHGLAWPAAARYLLDAVGSDRSEEYIFDRWRTEVPAGLRQGVDWVPGARELLDEMLAAGVPCGLVSASFSDILEPVVEQLPPGTFGAVVAGNDVTNGKPHPEPYRRAAELLGVDPRECLVIEDSGGGCDSGNAAGAVVLAVPSELPIEPAARRVQVPTLAGRTWADVVDAIAPAWDQ